MEALYQLSQLKFRAFLAIKQALSTLICHAFFLSKMGYVAIVFVTYISKRKMLNVSCPFLFEKKLILNR